MLGTTMYRLYWPRAGLTTKVPTARVPLPQDVLSGMLIRPSEPRPKLSTGLQRHSELESSRTRTSCAPVASSCGLPMIGPSPTGAVPAETTASLAPVWRLIRNTMPTVWSRT